MPMTPDDFAYNEYRDYVTYRELARIETIPGFKKILEELVQHELGDFNFWKQFSRRKEFRISPLFILFLKLMRKVLGLTFTAKFLEGNEKEAVRNYNEFLRTTQGEKRAKIQSIVDHEMYHERELIGQVKEERVEFISNIVLGINDALIELTGALIGFSFAFVNHWVIALTGLITGVAATLSMASSAYMQARHEKGRDARKASLYTGLSYAVIVVMLILPFLLIPDIFIARALMLTLDFLIVAFVSFCTSVLFERSFRRQFGEMVLFTLGVAFVAFLIGLALRGLMG